VCLLLVSTLLAGCGKLNVVADLADAVAVQLNYDTSLVDAIDFGSLEGVKEALENGADINNGYTSYPIPHSVNPYWYASNHGINSRVPEYLLEHGASVNELDSDGETLLMNAAGGDRVDDCQMYLSYGADINQVGKNHYTALDLGAKQGSEKAVKYLIEQGATVTRQTLDIALSGIYDTGYKEYGTVRAILLKLLEQGEESGLEPIVEAAIIGDSDQLIALGNSGALTENNINWVGYNAAAFCNEDALALCVKNGFSLIQPDEYDSPLEIAAQYGNVATVKWMIEHWVQYGQNEAIRYPLSEAAEYGQYDVAAYLLSLDAAVEVIDNFSPLSDTAENGDLKMVNLLLNSGKFTSKDLILTALSEAKRWDCEVMGRLFQEGSFTSEDLEGIWNASIGNLETMKLCVANGSNPVDGYTLIVAATYGYYDCAEYLIQMGTDAAYYNAELQETPLEMAVSRGYLDIVQLLVENGADVNQTGELFGSILQVAAISSAHITQYLVEHGADLDYQMENGNTALMAAVQAGRTDCAEILLEAGADVNLENEDGKTASDLAGDESVEMRALFSLE